MLAAVACMGLGATSCNDDVNGVSRKVLASTDVLEYEATNAAPQLIRVTSDGTWSVEAPEWVSVEKTQGEAGQTELEISVSDNVRDGAVDTPRKGEVKFKGRNLESIATVIIRQNGDKYRDPKDYSIDEMETALDETMVRIPNLTVAALTQSGFVATDGSKFVVVKKAEKQPAVGDKVAVQGEKWFSTEKMSYLTGDRISIEGNGAAPALTAEDITASLDAVVSSTPIYVSVTGTFDGNSLKVAGQGCAVYFDDTADALGLKQLAGHNLTVSGFFYGNAAPVVRVIPSSVKDLGLNQVIYYADDFEWMDPWCVKNGAVDYVGESDTAAAQSINIGNTDEAGKTLYEELCERGYNFVKATAEGKEDRPFETRIYMQRNYLKFGLTGIEAGIVLPSSAFEKVPAGEDVVFNFDWSPMRQGNPGATGRKYDAVQLVVIVENDGVEVKLPVPGHTLAAGANHEWMHASISLAGQKLDKNTKVTVRSVDDRWPLTTVNRWFMDNIRIVKAD